MTEILNNRFRTDRWKEDSIQSVDFYNHWFLTSAPKAYRIARSGVIDNVLLAIKSFEYLRSISVDALISNPKYLSVLRASTAPPLAIDRLAGLAGTTRNIISSLENGTLPGRRSEEEVRDNLTRIISIIKRLLDYDIFPWLNTDSHPSTQAINRSASIVADRISGALANPIIRNSQEARQLKAIDDYLQHKGYRKLASSEIFSVETMPPLSYAFHYNIPVELKGRSVNMPIDVVIQTPCSFSNNFPLLVECKSAGDFTNTNKRRKEEATKVTQLRHTYGKDKISFILFLCGYFDISYLGYEAAENIDWIWEHRISDFSAFGI